MHVSPLRDRKFFVFCSEDECAVNTRVGDSQVCWLRCGLALYPSHTAVNDIEPRFLSAINQTKGRSTVTISFNIDVS